MIAQYNTPYHIIVVLFYKPLTTRYHFLFNLFKRLYALVWEV
jgi:hypothetical protein